MKTFCNCCCINEVSCAKTAYNMWVDLTNFDNFLQHMKVVLAIAVDGQGGGGSLHHTKL